MSYGITAITADFGSANLGSIPGGTTMKIHKLYKFDREVIEQSLFEHELNLPLNKCFTRYAYISKWSCYVYPAYLIIEDIIFIRNQFYENK